MWWIVASVAGVIALAFATIVVLEATAPPDGYQWEVDPATGKKILARHGD